MKMPLISREMLAERHPLDVFFAPRSVAVVGASERPGSVGRAVLENLLAGGLRGKVFAVNPARSTVLDHPAYPSLEAIGQPVDLAILATPPATIPGLVEQCGAVGISGAVVISAGFKETGPEGAALEQELLAVARRSGVRLVGPNCVGIMSPGSGLNATFAHGMARPGSIAFLSQSGAMCTAVLDWSFRELVGFSAFVSTGSMLDIGWGDLISYLGEDSRTHAILIYMETVGDAREFLSAAREVALAKPIIVIKAGRTAPGGKAAASHTGSLTGSDEVLDAAFRRSGVLRVTSIADVFHMAEVLAKQPRPKGPRLTIVTNAGGPAVLATDALVAAGGELAALSESSLDGLNAVLPPTWSHQNPVDIIGDASAQRFSDAVSIAAKDPGSDGLLVILTPQAMTDPLQVAEGLRPYARLGKPLLASWMGGPLVDAGRNVLNTAGIPTFDYPDTAARMFQYMWSYTENLRGLYETPAADPDPDAKVTQAATLIAAAAAAGRTVLSELESKELLSYYGIPVTRTTLARTVDEAVSAAHGIGYPVVLKLHSHTVTHKTEAGGVHLNLGGPAQVQQAFAAIQAGVPAEAFQGVTVQPMERLQGVELILGSSVDPQFGPVLLFGAGGTLVEILEDKALGLPPLTSTLARRMMEQTRIHKALKGFRGRPPVDQAHLETLLVRFSRLVVEQPRIAEIEINPLLVSAERIVGLDARVVLHPAAVTEPPRPAIRPYPSQYVSQWIARGGTPLRLRPIRPEDEQLMVKFHESVSDHSVYLRYFQFLKLSQRVAHERLVRICFNDYDREIALVAERLIGPEPTIIGVGRLRKTSEEQAELGLLIIDSAQGMGLGTEMVRRLIEIGRLEGLRSIHADVHSENPKMLHLLRKFGFKMAIEPGDPVLTGQLIL